MLKQKLQDPPTVVPAAAAAPVVPTPAPPPPRAQVANPYVARSRLKRVELLPAGAANANAANAAAGAAAAAAAGMGGVGVIANGGGGGGIAVQTGVVGMRPAVPFASQFVAQQTPGGVGALAGAFARLSGVCVRACAVGQRV
jgi:hypothetical protein